MMDRERGKNREREGEGETETQREREGETGEGTNARMRGREGKRGKEGQRDLEGKTELQDGSAFYLRHVAWVYPASEKIICWCRLDPQYSQTFQQSGGLNRWKSEINFSPEDKKGGATWDAKVWVPKIACLSWEDHRQVRGGGGRGQGQVRVT